MIGLMFDVDGVIAETPHEEAWKDAAVEWKIIPTGYDFTRFYAEHVAGEPGATGAYNILSMLRYNGKSFFEREVITARQEQIATAETFRNPVKQKHVDAYVAAGKFREFEDVTTMIRKAKEAAIPVMAVSSSETAAKILGKLGLLSIFDVTALGAKTYWKRGIEKINHYAMAYGKLLERTGCECIDKIVVFEDAPKGIEAVARLGFCPVGITRTSTSGVCLATKDQLYAAGAKAAYDEEELKHLTLKEILEV